MDRNEVEQAVEVELRLTLQEMDFIATTLANLSYGIVVKAGQTQLLQKLAAQAQQSLELQQAQRAKMEKLAALEREARALRVSELQKAEAALGLGLTKDPLPEPGPEPEVPGYIVEHSGCQDGPAHDR